MNSSDAVITIAVVFSLLTFAIHPCFSNVNNDTEEDDYGDYNWNPRVVNGWPAMLGDVPYQVAFKRSSGIWFSTFCGGVIISPLKTVSAAHCFYKSGKNFLRKKKTYAVAGNLLNRMHFPFREIEATGQWRKLKRIAYPVKYKFPDLDIALVFLKEPFLYNEYIGPIPIATKFIDYRGPCLVSGFGRKTKKMRSGRLMLAHLELISTAMCSRIHRKNMYKFVCASARLTDVATGDSGSPLVCKNTGDPNEGHDGILVGIVSGARSRGSFFTRISAYTGFLSGNIVESTNNTSMLSENIISTILIIYTIFLLF